MIPDIGLLVSQWEGITAINHDALCDLGHAKLMELRSSFTSEPDMDAKTTIYHTEIVDELSKIYKAHAQMRSVRISHKKPMKGEGKYIVVTKCRHKFYRICLRRWIEENGTCPNCRFDIAQFPKEEWEELKGEEEESEDDGEETMTVELVEEMETLRQSMYQDHDLRICIARGDIVSVEYWEDDIFRYFLQHIGGLLERGFTLMDIRVQWTPEDIDEGDMFMYGQVHELIESWLQRSMDAESRRPRIPDTNVFVPQNRS